MKTRFDIKYRPQIESGEYKVVTGDDRPVRIISWDKKVFGGRYEIVALVPTSQGDTETVQLYCPDGTLGASGWNEKFKLFVVTPEPELTDWQTFISGCLQKHGLLDCGAADRIAKECSAELLELARKELEPEVLERLEVAYKNQDEVVYENGKKDGKAEALKDLPRWRKAKRDMTVVSSCLVELDGHTYTSNFIPYGSYYISIQDLLKLPRLKED